MIPLGQLILWPICFACGFVFDFVLVFEFALALSGAPVFVALAKAGLPLTLPFLQLLNFWSCPLVSNAVTGSATSTSSRSGWRIPKTGAGAVMAPTNATPMH
jgi:hypothetical protein